MYSLFGSSIYLDLKSEETLKKQPNPSNQLRSLLVISDWFSICSNLHYLILKVNSTKWDFYLFFNNIHIHQIFLLGFYFFSEGF